MKRECLLSRAYTGGPMTLEGREIAYSALANEIIREFKTSIFNADAPQDQTDYCGIAECVLVMSLLERKDFEGVKALRLMSRPDRHSAVLSFALDHAAEIDRLQTEILARLESLQAAAVESVEPGKSQPPPPDSSP